jgi:hypothetical protein
MPDVACAMNPSSGPMDTQRSAACNVSAPTIFSDDIVA